MSRLASDDFVKLIDYVDKYRIRSLSDTPANEALFRQAHRLTLGAIQLWVELDRMATANGSAMLGTAALGVNSKEFDQLSECFSDITSAFASAMHGLFKPS